MAAKFYYGPELNKLTIAINSRENINDQRQSFKYSSQRYKHIKIDIKMILGQDI